MVIIEGVEYGGDEPNSGWVKINGQLIVSNVGRNLAARIYNNLATLKDNTAPFGGSTAVTTEIKQHFRELRLWHWRQRQMYRDLAVAQRRIALISIRPAVAADHHAKAEEYDAQADYHIGAVQTLNEAPGCAATTAEQDDATH